LRGGLVNIDTQRRLRGAARQRRGAPMHKAGEPDPNAAPAPVDECASRSRRGGAASRSRYANRIGTAADFCTALDTALAQFRTELGEVRQVCSDREARLLDTVAERLDALLHCVRSSDVAPTGRSRAGELRAVACLAGETDTVARLIPNAARHGDLSRRELEIFRLIASGLSVGQIAKRLHISVKTVSTHRAHILDKLCMTNNAEITRYALEHRLV
jgi:DNA-binding CsgD family transcriptional regulator